MFRSTEFNRARQWEYGVEEFFRTRPHIDPVHFTKGVDHALGGFQDGSYFHGVASVKCGADLDIQVWALLGYTKEWPSGDRMEGLVMGRAPNHRVDRWRKYQQKRMARGTAVKCCYCGAPLTSETLTAEHVVPYSKGGKRMGAGNLDPACGPCNVKRGNGPRPPVVVK